MLKIKGEEQIKKDIIMKLLFILYLLVGCLILKAQQTPNSDTNVEKSLKHETFQLPPHFCLLIPYSGEKQGNLGIQLMGSLVDNETFLLGWRNALFFEENSECDIWGLFTGMYGNVKKMYGLQISTLNDSQYINGMQLAALANLSIIGRGIQISPLLNSANNFNGIQISLGGNQLLESQDINKDKDYIVQLGILNLNQSKNTWGIQLGGINRTSERIVQVGILNYSEKSFFKFFPFINF
jgi:lipoprotein